MHHVAAQAAEYLATPNHRTGQNVHGLDTAIGKGAQVRGVLLVHSHLAGDGERTRCALHQDKRRLDAGVPLIFGRDFDDVVRLRSTLGRLVRLILRGRRRRARRIRGRFAGMAGSCLAARISGRLKRSSRLSLRQFQEWLLNRIEEHRHG